MSPRWCWPRVDTPGLLADVAGVLYANRIEVVDAAIYSRRPSDATRRRPRRSTSFACATATGRPSHRRGALGQDSRRISRARAPGGVKVGGLVAPPAGRLGRRLEGRPTCRPSSRSTTRSAATSPSSRSSPGLARRAATRSRGTLFAEGLDIHRSKIATEANRVIDVFYVRDKAQKVTDEITVRGDALEGRARGTLLAVAAPDVVTGHLAMTLLAAAAVCCLALAGAAEAAGCRRAAPLPRREGADPAQAGRCRGRARRVRRRRQGGSQGRAASLPARRRAREEGRRVGGGREPIASHRAQGGLPRGRTTTSAGCCSPRATPRAPPPARGGRQGAPGLRRGALQPGRRARRPGQEGRGRRLPTRRPRACGPPRRLPAEPRRGPAAQGDVDGALAALRRRRDSCPRTPSPGPISG